MCVQCATYIVIHKLYKGICYHNQFSIRDLWLHIGASMERAMSSAPSFEIFLYGATSIHPEWKVLLITQAGRGSNLHIGGTVIVNCVWLMVAKKPPTHFSLIDGGKVRSASFDWWWQVKIRHDWLVMERQWPTLFDRWWQGSHMW